MKGETGITGLHKLAVRQLVNHRRVAEWFDMSPKTLRRQVEKGIFPEPHIEQGSFLLYDLSVIQHRLATGLWPDGTPFRRVKLRAQDPPQD